MSSGATGSIHVAIGTIYEARSLPAAVPFLLSGCELHAAVTRTKQLVDDELYIR